AGNGSAASSPGSPVEERPRRARWRWATRWCCWRRSARVDTNTGMKALVLVDIQNDFLPGGALGVPRGNEVVPVANRLQPRFGLVVATQDWHPKGHGSFASTRPGRKPGEVAELGG